MTLGHCTVLFGGLGVSQKVLAKYAAVYGRNTQIVPFTFTCMLAGEQYRPYRRLHMDLRQRGGPMHIHAPQIRASVGNSSPLFVQSPTGLGNSSPRWMTLKRQFNHRSNHLAWF